MRTLLCLIALPALLAAQSPRDRQRLAALLPDAAALGAASAKPARFYAADLYRYLDGGADAYKRRGFASLIHREYKTKNAELTVDIYDMGVAANAAAIYAAERPPDCRSIAIGEAGYADKGVINFHQARYYVKLMAFSDAADPAALLESAARAVSARVGDLRIGKRSSR